VSRTACPTGSQAVCENFTKIVKTQFTPLCFVLSNLTQRKGNKRRFAETNKQISISDEGGVLKGSFQGDTFENLQASNDG